jgi:hypothetical protein
VVDLSQPRSRLKSIIRGTIIPGVCHQRGGSDSRHPQETGIHAGEGAGRIEQQLMSGIWKKVNRFNWDLDGGKNEIERLKGEGFIPVEPIQPEPVLNEPAYLILCEPVLRED